MFIVGKSFFSEILSKFNIKTIAPLCIIQIPSKMLMWHFAHDPHSQNQVPDKDIGCHSISSSKIYEMTAF